MSAEEVPEVKAARAKTLTELTLMMRKNLFTVLNTCPVNSNVL